MVKGMEYRSGSHRFQPGNEHAVLYRHRLGRANSYFPLTPFTVHAILSFKLPADVSRSPS